MYDKTGCGKRLKELRENRDKTQQEVADAVGISVDAIRKIEQGKRLPSVEVVELLRDYYNTTADYIICGYKTYQIEYEEMLKSMPRRKRAIAERIWKSIRELIV